MVCDVICSTLQRCFSRMACKIFGSSVQTANKNDGFEDVRNEIKNKEEEEEVSQALIFVGK